MKISALTLKNLLKKHKPSFFSSKNLLEQEFRAYLITLIETTLTSEGNLTEEGIFRLAVKLQEAIDNSNQNTSRLNSFGELLKDLAEKIGFDVLSAVRNLKDNNDAYKLSDFNKSLTQVMNARNAYLELSNVLIKTSWDIRNSLLEKKSRLKLQSSRLQTPLHEDEYSRQYNLSRNAKKPSGKMLISWDDNMDGKGGTCESNPYPQMIPDLEARRLAAIVCERIEQQRQAHKEKKESELLEISKSIALVKTQIKNIELLQLNHSNIKNTECYKFQKFISHYKIINSVCNNLNTFLDQESISYDMKNLQLLQNKFNDSLPLSILVSKITPGEKKDEVNIQNNNTATNLEPSAPLPEISSVNNLNDNLPSAPLLNPDQVEIKEEKYTRITELLSQLTDEDISDAAAHPTNITCPMHLSIMVDPGIASDSRYYDRCSAEDMIHKKIGYIEGTIVTTFQSSLEKRATIIKYLENKIKQKKTLQQSSNSTPIKSDKEISSLIGQNSTSGSPVFTAPKNNINKVNDAALNNFLNSEVPSRKLDNKPAQKPLIISP